jgi:hypothetical protein
METKSVVDIVACMSILDDASCTPKRRHIFIVSALVLSQLLLNPGDLLENIVIFDSNVEELPTGAELSVGNSKLLTFNHVSF